MCTNLLAESGKRGRKAGPGSHSVLFFCFPRVPTAL